MALRLRGLPSGWGSNIPTDRAGALPWVAAVRRDPAERYPWGGRVPMELHTTHPWQPHQPVDGQDRLPWGVHAKRERADTLAYGPPAPVDGQDRLVWGVHARRDRADNLAYGRSQPTDTQDRLVWGVHAARDTQSALRFGGPRAADTQDRLPWGPGWRIHNYRPPVIPPSPEPITQWIVPIRRIYLVANAAIITIDGLELPAFSAQVSIDTDSWAWRWSASLPGSTWPTVAAAADDPVAVVITINGVQWSGLCESVSRSRQFGQSSVSVSGRGHAAYLAAPYAPSNSRYNTETRTVQQLAEDCLTENGVPIGWTIAWGTTEPWAITSWNVPAGAWSHQGAPIDGVLRIAEAAGAYVQADPNTDTLHVRRRYPWLPRDWAEQTPDVILPTAAVLVESVERKDQPGYTGVYVTGQSPGGVIGQVKITGSDGTPQAPSVVDALCTHADAARQRGTAILGNTGRQYWLTLNAPISSEIVLLQVGDLVQYDSRIGLVRGVQVSARWNDGVEVRQSITLETHA